MSKKKKEIKNWREELEDLSNISLSGKAREAIEYLKSNSCAVPFFQSLSEGDIARFGVCYAIAKKKTLPKDPNEFDTKGQDWKYGTKNIVGSPSIENLLNITSEVGEESHPSRVFAMYANMGLEELHANIKKGESLDKILE